MIYITGPTASGKSAVAIELAKLIDTEIISMDSMSIYRRMNIGTAKPTLSEQQGIRHHLIDIREPNEEYSVADYCKDATEIAEKLRSANKTPLFVGGTPLYLKAMIRGFFDGPPGDETVRAKLQRFHESGGNLHARLEAIDSESAQRLHPNDVRRLIRAIEVYEITGKPISSFQTQFDEPSNQMRQNVFVIYWDRVSLNRRIDMRVDSLFEQGFLDEAKSLFAEPMSKTAAQAVGYRELFEHFRGKHSLEEAVELIKIHTHQFAKRQRTWFRSLSECRFIHAATPFDAKQIAETIISQQQPASSVLAH